MKRTKVPRGSKGNNKEAKESNHSCTRPDITTKYQNISKGITVMDQTMFQLLFSLKGEYSYRKQGRASILARGTVLPWYNYMPSKYTPQNN